MSDRYDERAREIVSSTIGHTYGDGVPQLINAIASALRDAAKVAEGHAMQPYVLGHLNRIAEWKEAFRCWLIPLKNVEAIDDVKARELLRRTLEPN